MSGTLPCVVAMLAGAVALPAPAQPTGNVPDVVARRSGLHVEPMAHAAVIYAQNCQGCHGEAGRSVPEIPALAGRVGYFARTPAGRRYLAQVPNVALNPSSDADIAELLNWLLATFSRAELPERFTPYTQSEVGALRSERIEPRLARQRVVDELVAAGLVPSAETLAGAYSVPH